LIAISAQKKQEFAMRSIQATPQKIVENGRANYGIYKTPFQTMNLHEIDIFGKDGASSVWLRDLRLKEWQHFGIIHPHYYFGFVIFDAKYMAMSFFYVYDRNKRTFREHKSKRFQGIKVPTDLFNDRGFFRHKGYAIEIENRLTQNFHTIAIDIQKKGKLPAVRGNITIHEDIVKHEPLVAVLPIAPHRPLYTHKNLCPVSGQIRIDQETIELQANRDLVLMDIQKTYYPKNTFWKWATFGGYTPAGDLVGVNLTKNMIEADDEVNENCLWLNGKLALLSGVDYRYNLKNVLQPWQMRTRDNRCDLTFQPEGERSEYLNFGIIKSDFHQPAGKFQGHVIDDNGRRVEIRDLFGVAEHHVSVF
jgi:hypothetical protein